MVGGIKTFLYHPLTKGVAPLLKTVCEKIKWSLKSFIRIIQKVKELCGNHKIHAWIFPPIKLIILISKSNSNNVTNVIMWTINKRINKLILDIYFLLQFLFRNVVHNLKVETRKSNTHCIFFWGGGGWGGIRVVLFFLSDDFNQLLHIQSRTYYI